MKNLPKIAALLLSAIGLCASAQSVPACPVRYQAVYDASIRARYFAPASERERLSMLSLAIGNVMDLLGSNSKEAVEACGDPLQKLEAQAIVWHQRGWTPTREEAEAIDRAKSLRELKDMLDGKLPQ